MIDPRLLLLSPSDTVFLLREAIAPGTRIQLEEGSIVVAARLGLGHKVARRAIKAGERVFKYGAPIGTASADIAAGEWVHVHNLRSDYTATHARGG